MMIAPIMVFLYICLEQEMPQPKRHVRQQIIIGEFICDIYMSLIR